MSSCANTSSFDLQGCFENCSQPYSQAAITDCCTQKRANSDPDSYQEFCISSPSGSGWPNDEIQALQIEVERTIDDSSIEGCVMSTFIKNYTYNDIDSKLQSVIDSCKKAPQPAPQPKWSQSDMTMLKQFTQKLNVNNTQSQCLMDNISKNYSSMNEFINAAKNKDNNIINIFIKCGVKDPNSGPNNSLNNGINNILNNISNNSNNKPTCTGPFKTGDNCDKLSGLSIALIVIGCILALVLLYFMITYKPTPTNFAEIARYHKEMYGFN